MSADGPILGKDDHRNGPPNLPPITRREPRRESSLNIECAEQGLHVNQVGLELDYQQHALCVERQEVDSTALAILTE